MMQKKMGTKEEFSDQSLQIPKEILVEILIKLPPKSIFRFRCVSKNWLSLICDPSFFPCYVSRSTESPPFALIFHFRGLRSYVYTWNTFKNSSVSPFPCDRIQRLKVEATSNDLILYGHESAYFLANCFTRQCVVLPVHGTRRSYGSMGLVSRVKNGTARYNVVRLIKHCDNNRSFSLNVETFSCEDGMWRNFKLKNCMPNVEVDTRPCIVFKGAVHWICNRMTTLLAYDPCSSSRDQYRFISVPNEAYSMSGMNAILGVLGENLYYFEMSRISIEGCKLPGWKLWVMRDYENGEWSLDRAGKERKIDESFGVVHKVLSTHSPLFPMALHPWNKDVVYFWYEGYILSFNVMTGWFEDKFSTLSCESMVSTWEIFPLLMPLCPTQLPEPQWDWQYCRSGG